MNNNHKYNILESGYKLLIQPISKYFYLFPSVLKYFNVFPPISKYFQVFPTVSKYFYVFLCISIYFHLFLSISVFSQSDSLSNYLDIAAKNNPDLKSKYNKYLADLQKVPQVGSLPDPDVSFGYFIKPMELVNGNQIAQIQLMQMFPWFGTLKAAKDEASLMALSSFELFRAEKEEIFFNIRTTYYQLFLTQKQIQVYDTTLVLLKSIEQLLMIKSGTVNLGTTKTVNSSQVPNGNNTSGNSGMGMNTNNQSSNNPANTSMNTPSMAGNNTVFSDLLRLKVEIKEFEDNIASLHNRKQLLIIQINTLLNRKTSIEIYIPDILEFPAFDFYNPALFDTIKLNNPMVKMNHADIIAYQQKQKMSKKMGYPMFGLGLNYMLINKNNMNTSAMNGKDMMMPMLSMKLPIYRKKYNASIKEAQYLEISSNEQLINAENMLLMEYSEYLFSLKDAERKLSLYQDIVLLAKKNFDLLLVQYYTSGADFETLIRLQSQLLDYKLNYIQAQVDKLSAMAGLMKLLSIN